MGMSVADLAPRMGSEVTIGRAELISGEHATAIRRLLDARGVLLFRGAKLDDIYIRSLEWTYGMGESYWYVVTNFQD